MKKKFLASALAASMVGTMFASMPAFAEEESSSAAAEEVMKLLRRYLHLLRFPFYQEYT